MTPHVHTAVGKWPLGNGQKEKIQNLKVMTKAK